VRPGPARVFQGPEDAQGSDDAQGPEDAQEGLPQVPETQLEHRGKYLS
jgi:hypothetical protein